MCVRCMILNIISMLWIWLVASVVYIMRPAFECIISLYVIQSMFTVLFQFLGCSVVAPCAFPFCKRPRISTSQREIYLTRFQSKPPQTSLFPCIYSMASPTAFVPSNLQIALALAVVKSKPESISVRGKYQCLAFLLLQTLERQLSRLYSSTPHTSQKGTQTGAEYLSTSPLRQRSLLASTVRDSECEMP